MRGQGCSERIVKLGSDPVWSTIRSKSMEHAVRLVTNKGSANLLEKITNPIPSRGTTW